MISDQRWKYERLAFLPQKKPAGRHDSGSRAFHGIRLKLASSRGGSLTLHSAMKLQCLGGWRSFWPPPPPHPPPHPPPRPHHRGRSGLHPPQPPTLHRLVSSLTPLPPRNLMALTVGTWVSPKHPTPLGKFQGHKAHPPPTHSTELQSRVPGTSAHTVPTELSHCCCPPSPGTRLLRAF